MEKKEPEQDPARVKDDPVSVLASVDWSLGTRNPVVLVFRYALVCGAALVALALVGVSLVGGFSAFRGGGGRAEELMAPGLLAPLAASISFAMFEAWAFGTGGWWGQAVQRLSGELPSVAGRVRGKFGIVAGLRVRHTRPFLLLFAPYRMILITRGWNAPVIGVLMVWQLLLLAPAITSPGYLQALPMWLGSGLMMNGIALLLMGRRMCVHEVPYDAVRRVEFQSRVVYLRVTVVDLPDELRLRAFADQETRLVEQLALCCPDVCPALEGDEVGTEDPSNEGDLVEPPPDAPPVAGTPAAEPLSLPRRASIGLMMAAAGGSFGLGLVGLATIGDEEPALGWSPGVLLFLGTFGFAFFALVKWQLERGCREWWGWSLERQRAGRASVVGRVTGRLPVASGVRLQQTQALLALFAPGGLTLVTHGKQGLVLAAALVWPVSLLWAAAAAGQGPGMDVHPGAFFAGMFMSCMGAIYASRTRHVRDVSWDSIGLIKHTEGEVELHIETGQSVDILVVSALAAQRRAFDNALRRYCDAPESRDGLDSTESSSPTDEPLSTDVEKRLARVQQHYQEDDA